MSVPMRILDLGGKALHVESGHTIPVQLPDDLNGQVMLITDYGSAPFGVDILPINTRHIAPVVEKRLRDQGDIDGLAQVIIHDDEHQGEMVRVFYTAIPVADFMQYRGWAERHSDHVLVFPLAEALLATAHEQALDNGVLSFVHGDTAEVLVVHERTAVASARLRLFGTGPDEYQRLAHTIAQLWQTHAGTPQGGTCIVIEDQSGAASPLAAALDTQAHHLACRSPLGAAVLFDGLKRSQADLSPTNNLLHACSLALPPVALLMTIMCLLASGLWLTWRADTQTLLDDIARASTPSQPMLRKDMTEALQNAHGLEQSQRDLADFVRLFDQVRKTPDPASLIHHLRLAAPANIAVTEAGIISDEDGILIIVAARSNTVAAPFDAERQFVNKLEGLGYQVVRREIEGGVDSSVFRLALTWSES